MSKKNKNKPKPTQKPKKPLFTRENADDWTLTGRVGPLLDRAEEWAGKRDNDWTFLGVELFGWQKDDALPHLFFPERNPTHVSIILTQDVTGNWPGAVYELAHEVMHLISPTGKADANCLEEGLCTAFQEDLAWELEKYRGTRRPEYDEPTEDIRKVLAIDPHAIRKIREKYGKGESCKKDEKPLLPMNDIRPEHLLDVCPTLDPDIAKRLCRPFKNPTKAA